MALNDGRVVTNFITQALRGEDITVYGEGVQTRSFCYVSDLISGLTSLFFTEKVHQPINLGNPKPITMVELAREIISLTNSNSKVVYAPLPSDDPRDREPEISKAREILNWEPKINREEGLLRTIEDVRKQMECLA